MIPPPTAEFDATKKSADRGSLWRGFLVGWGVLIGSYAALIGLGVASFDPALEKQILDTGAWQYCWMLPWFGLLGISLRFQLKQHVRSAVGVLLTIASVPPLLLLFLWVAFGMRAMQQIQH